MDIEGYLRDKKAQVEAFMAHHLTRPLRPEVLKESMLYSLMAGGKRLRPVLALATYEACGKNPDTIVRYAAALEMIHTYSLIHDDLPSMDNDDLRRGKPTNHKVYGEAMAILAGDALLTEAFGLLIDTDGGKVSEGALLAAAREVALAAGVQGMVAGQAQDILSESSEIDEETLVFIHTHKTATLIKASVMLGALLAGAGEDEKAALESYGANVGLAFQIVDDILDIKGDTKELGKPAGSDERKNKMTYPALYGVGPSMARAEELITKAVAALSDFGPEAEPLRAVAMLIIERRN